MANLCVCVDIYIFKCVESLLILFITLCFAVFKAAV